MDFCALHNNKQKQPVKVTGGQERLCMPGISDVWGAANKTPLTGKCRSGHKAVGSKSSYNDARELFGCTKIRLKMTNYIHH